PRRSRTGCGGVAPPAPLRPRRDCVSQAGRLGRVGGPRVVKPDRRECAQAARCERAGNPAEHLTPRCVEGRGRRAPYGHWSRAPAGDGEGALLSASDEVCVPAEVEPPAIGGGNAVAGGFPALAVTVEMTVLQLDAGALVVLGDEPHLDLAALARVGLDLPVGRDVPAEDDAVGRLVGEHGRPLALAAVGAPVVDAASDPGLEHRLLDVDPELV